MLQFGQYMHNFAAVTVGGALISSAQDSRRERERDCLPQLAIATPETPNNFFTLQSCSCLRTDVL
eukprot:scaffold5605_cov142-Skeletonema_marinoi.AAC.3